MSFDRPHLFTVLSSHCTQTVLLRYRARLVNYIKTSEVVRQPYPLQMRASGSHSYFMKRETWGWTDFLMNPMVNVVLNSKVDIGQICVNAVTGGFEENPSLL